MNFLEIVKEAETDNAKKIEIIYAKGNYEVIKLRDYEKQIDVFYEIVNGTVTQQIIGD